MSTTKSLHKDSHRSLIQSTSILALGTLSSRILGFLRDIVLARLLGTGMKADAFFVAFKIPNLFRDLIGEGATNAAVIPVLSEYKEKEQGKAFVDLVSILRVWALIILGVMTVLGILLAPFIVRLMAPGFIDDSEKLSLTVHLTRWLFPYLILIGLTAYSMGVLFTFRSFTAPAFGPCLLNMAMISSALICLRFMKEPLAGLVWGVLIGGILQLAFQWRAMSRIGIQSSRPKTLRHPAVIRIGRLLIPRMVGAGVYQLTVFIDTFCASLATIVGEGGISAIYYANRIIQCPMGIFSVAMASAVLPTLSGLASKNDVVSLKKTLVFSLENIFFVMCPITIGLLLLSEPIIRIFFQRGEFGLYSTMITASALSYYAIGLFSFGGIKILVTAFHALQDTRTPVKVAALCLVVNAVLNFILMFPMKVGGIALASSVAGTLDFLILFYVLDRRLGGLDPGLFLYFLKVLAAASLTGIGIFWCWNHVLFANEIFKFIVLGIGSVLFYEAVCLLLRVKQAQAVRDWAKEMFGRQRNTAEGI